MKANARNLIIRLTSGLGAVGIGMALVAIAAAHYWMQDGDGHRIITIAPQNRQLAGSTSLASKVSRASSMSGMSKDEQTQLAEELASSDPNRRENALAEIQAMAVDDRKSLALGLPQWVKPLIEEKRLDDVERFASLSVLDRPFDPVTVQAAARALVQVYISKGDNSHALQSAKSYYNVASLESSSEAEDFITRLSTEAGGSASLTELNEEQVSGHTLRSVLESIKVNSTPFEKAITNWSGKRGRNGAYSHENLMARGNLLLLADRPNEAIECFRQACKTETTADRNLRQAVEGIAQAMRAQAGSAVPAVAFIQSLRENPATDGQSLILGTKLSLEDVRLAAQETAISSISTQSIPMLEKERAAEENANDSSPAPEIVTGFEDSTPVYSASISPSHLVVEITTKGFRDWFMFKVRGVAGRTIRIDITGAYKTIPDWPQKNWSVNPVYTYASDINDPVIVSTPLSQAVKTERANNGTQLPNTVSQTWNYLPNVWSDQYTLSFVQHFDEDSAFIAMRVPRTVTYNAKYFTQLKSNARASVIEVGQSHEGRTLYLAQVGSTDIDKPCVLIYAGEHADEHDGGWAAQGAIDYLLGDAPTAAKLREQCTFLIIPMLDPDASAAGIHQAIMTSFLQGHETPESIAYANWFQKWIVTGHRLDLVIDLHNVQSGEAPHIFCPLIESVGARGQMSLALHKTIIDCFKEAGYGVVTNPQMRGWMPTRLCGWLSRNYGPLSIAYEINSQAPERHLTVGETTNMGAVFVQCVGKFLDSDKAKSLAESNRDGDPQMPADSADSRSDGLSPNAIAYTAHAPLSQPVQEDLRRENQIP